MYETHRDTWDSETVHTTLKVANAPTLRQDRSSGALTVSIGHVDLPAFVSNGCLYIQAPLPLVFEAFAEDLPAFVGDLEVRVSNSRGGTLSLDSNGRPVHRAAMAKPRVVRSSGKRR